jgi:hypothetical protein
VQPLPAAAASGAAPPSSAWINFRQERAREKKESTAATAADVDGEQTDVEDADGSALEKAHAPVPLRRATDPRASESATGLGLSRRAAAYYAAGAASSTGSGGGRNAPVGGKTFVKTRPVAQVAGIVAFRELPPPPSTGVGVGLGGAATGAQWGAIRSRSASRARAQEARAAAAASGEDDGPGLQSSKADGSDDVGIENPEIIAAFAARAAHTAAVAAEGEALMRAASAGKGAKSGSEEARALLADSLARVKAGLGPATAPTPTTSGLSADAAPPIPSNVGPKAFIREPSVARRRGDGAAAPLAQPKLFNWAQAPPVAAVAAAAAASDDDVIEIVETVSALPNQAPARPKARDDAELTTLMPPPNARAPSVARRR